MHLQAIQLVKCLCEKIRSLNDSNAFESLCKDVIFTAARLGIHEVVEEIIESFPEVVWLVDANNHNIFQLAVMYRCENVFNLIYQMSGYKQGMMEKMDNSRNSILHLVGQLAPHDKLNLVLGAALQMKQGDFLYVLPKRLIISLVTLFLSITTMILAFSSTLYLVFGHNKAWILDPSCPYSCPSLWISSLQHMALACSASKVIDLFISYHHQQGEEFQA
ncbi:hypothetical protein LOK49_Contig10G00005 [Camellia lanceoleosa]|nr:hypothetical protein LOK49_Contig10G00005 [Camellia lanceoleosa]